MAGKVVKPGAVFLSASVPDPKRHRRYWESADLIAIRDAVSALAEVVLPRQALVFGGHPAITPMIRLIAKACDARHHVVLYQSKFFAQVYPPDNQEFTDIVETEVKGDRESSLAYMRERMLTDTPFAAAFFIGGMEGVEVEFKALGQFQPEVPRFAVVSTGGAASQMPVGETNRHEAQRAYVLETRYRHELETDLAYLSLFRKILSDPSIGVI
jgi:hypothetical protein